MYLLTAPGIILLSLSASQCFITRTRDTEIAPGSISHQQITENALYLITAKLLNTMPSNTSTPIPLNVIVSPEIMFDLFYGKSVSTTNFIKAIDEILQSNAAVDFNHDTVDDPSWHFDSEYFEQGNTLLKRLWDTIFRSAMSTDYAQARSLIGQYLHVLQEFYSHSNWVEMGMTSPLDALGMAGMDIGKIVDPKAETCSDCPRANEPSSSYFCERNIKPYINDQRILTSGYHTVRKNGFIAQVKPVGKCGHGGTRDANQDQQPKGGINKDADSPSLSPHHYLHSEASRLAQRASLQMLDRLLKAINNDRFAALMNIGVATSTTQASKSLVIVMDTTGSMGEYIEAAKQRCFEIIDASLAAGTKPKDFVLVPFNDFELGYGPVVRTTDPNQFKAEISELKAIGGRDEDELCFPAILLAAQQSEMGSPIFVFTDAPTKEKDLYASIEATVQQKKQPVFFIGLNPYSIDPLYIRLAEASGGRVLVTTTVVGEIFDTTEFLTEQIKSGKILLVNSKAIGSLSKTIEFAVDPLLETLEISLGHNSLVPSMQLYRPDGSVLSVVADTNTATTRLYRINAPTAGKWRIVVTASQANWYIEISGNSALDVLSQLEYPADDIARFPGYRVLENNPLMNEELIFAARSTRSAFTPKEVRLLHTNGNAISVFPLDHSKLNNDYIANFKVPSEPFFIEVKGVHSSGTPFQRLQASQVVPTQIRLSFFSGDRAVDEMMIGQTMNISFSVQNEGQAENFQLTAKDSLGFISSFNPKIFRIESGATINAFVYVVVPSTSPSGGVSDVVMSVSLYGGTSRYNANFFRKRISIVSPAIDVYPPECKVTSSNFEKSCERTPANDGNCARRKWTASVQFNERGSGIESIVVDDSGNGDIKWSLPANYSSVGNTSVNATATGTCCTELVTFSVVDKSGLSNRCVMEREEVLSLSINSPEDETALSLILPPGKSRYVCYIVKIHEEGSITINPTSGTVAVYVSLSSDKPGPPAAHSHIKMTVKEGKTRILYTKQLIAQFDPLATDTSKICFGFHRSASRVRSLGFEDDADVELNLLGVERIVTECGGDVYLPVATQAVEINGPGFVDGLALGYPGGLDCVWNIQAPPGHYLEITTPFFNLLDNNDLDFAKEACSGDDALHIFANKKSDRICGHSDNRMEIIYYDNEAQIILTTSRDAPYGYGFNLMVTALLTRG